MKIDFSKDNGLVPVVIQDNRTLQVLMLGYMNEEAFEKTKKEGIVTFFSRSKTDSGQKVRNRVIFNGKKY